jgi:hypothetical protein
MTSFRAHGLDRASPTVRWVLAIAAALAVGLAATALAGSTIKTFRHSGTAIHSATNAPDGTVSFKVTRKGGELTKIKDFSIAGVTLGCIAYDGSLSEEPTDPQGFDVRELKGHNRSETARFKYDGAHGLVLFVDGVVTDGGRAAHGTASLEAPGSCTTGVVAWTTEAR